MFERFKNVWNRFQNKDPTPIYPEGGYFGSYRPDRVRIGKWGVQSVVESIYNKIAVDVASIDIQHVRLNENHQYEDTIYDSLNRVLTLEANLDQTGRNLIKEAVLTMFDKGSVALVPIDTDTDPRYTDSFKIYTLRVGEIVGWYPRHVRVEIYDEHDGNRKQILVEKRTTAIIENPFYTIMNEPNSVAQRLLRTQRQLDQFNENSCSGKLDLIVQVPYTLKSPALVARAKKRVKDIEFQLSGSKYGIAYADGTEKIVQLNRSLENNLWTQTKELQEQLYNQMGFSQSIFDGTADEKTMLNYRNRTLEPVLNDLTEEMERKWISRTAQTQGQAIRYFSDPFKLVPVAQIAEIADKFTRNEIMTSNEMRSVIGLKPSKDPKADELRNSNLNHPDEKQQANNIQNETNKEE